jgi:hypothetical protein
VEAILRDGPRALAIRADVDVVRSEQAARLAVPNPSVSYSWEGAGFTDFLLVEQALPFSAFAVSWPEPASLPRRRPRPSGTPGCSNCGPRLWAR